MKESINHYLEKVIKLDTDARFEQFIGVTCEGACDKFNECSKVTRDQIFSCLKFQELVGYDKYAEDDTGGDYMFRY